MTTVARGIVPRPARTVTAAAVAVVLLAVAGCGSGGGLPEPDLASRVDVDSRELRQQKQRAGVAPCLQPEGPGSELADLTLPCLGGGRDVRLSDLSGPAVVSLWASWCVSCPDELPLFQRLAEQTRGRLSVLGVDYQDTRPGAAVALLDETGAVFPQLADPGGDLADHYRVAGLPGVLLVDRDGEVTFLLRRIERYAELTALVMEHTGVDPSAG